VLEAVAPVLRGATEDLRIDGHTNQVPVKPRFFATDWDLSSARAVTVLRYLQEVGRIPGERLSAAAFGHEVPLIDPAEPRSQAINKRVDIVVLSSLPAASRALLDDVAAGTATTPDPTDPTQGGSS
jgi:chemotaxis protein MotB